MQSRSPIRASLHGLLTLMLFIAPLSFATTAQAGLWADQIPPTLCKSQRIAGSGDRTRYEGTSIGVRPSSSPWDYDFVMCPINRFNPSDDVVEIRVFTEGERATSGWCQLYEAPDSDSAVAFEYPASLGSNGGKVTFEPPSTAAANGLVALTVRCLLFPGNSITSMEIIWER